jgi:hypothetical protein
MEHRFWALGSFDESFESYIDRTNEFRRSNGKPSVIVERQRPPADFAGIAFGYMQLPNEGSEERYVAVGAQCDTIDVRCHSPLLIDMTRLNVSITGQGGSRLSSLDLTRTGRLGKNMIYRLKLLCFRGVEALLLGPDRFYSHP